MSSLRQELTLTLGEAVELISDADLETLHASGYRPDIQVRWRRRNQLCTTDEALTNVRLEKGRR